MNGRHAEVADAAMLVASSLAEAIDWLATVPHDQREGLAALIVQDIAKWKRAVHRKREPVQSSR